MNEEKKRTDQQRKSIELFCKNLGESLNGQGFYMQVILKPTYELRWDQKSAKENLFKPIAKALYGVTSTTELTTDQVSKVHEQLMLMLIEKFPEIEYVDFPSEETTQNYLESLRQMKL